MEREEGVPICEVLTLEHVLHRFELRAAENSADTIALFPRLDGNDQLAVVSKDIRPEDLLSLLYLGRDMFKRGERVGKSSAQRDICRTIGATFPEE